MYEEFFGLTQRPFSAVPNPEDFVSIEPMQEALESLIHCISHSRGIAVVTSSPGMGKSLLCKRLALLLQAEAHSVYLSASAFQTRRAMLQAALFELGVSYVGLSEQEARLHVFETARQLHAERRSLLLIIDEAHLLNTRLFEELRTLADYSPDGGSLIKLVLCGQFELEEKLVDPALAAFNQRIGAQICLDQLTVEQSAQLMIARLKSCGVADVLSVITGGAIELICRASDGNLRCLTQLTDHAFLLAFAAEQMPVSESIVRDALDDLKELPLQWSDVALDLPPRQNLAIEESDDDDLSASAWDHDLGNASRPLAIEIAISEQETDEFPVPDELRGLAHSAATGESAADEDSHDASTLDQSEDSEAAFVVFEVGSGIDDVPPPQAEEPSSSAIALESSAPLVSDSIQPWRTPMTETPVVDHCALLDRLLELPEERRASVTIPPPPVRIDTAHTKYPYLSQLGPASAPDDASPFIEVSEETLLETIQQIRQDIVDTVDYTRLAGAFSSQPPATGGATQTLASPGYDVVEPIESAPAMQKPAPGVESGGSRLERRFSQLFSRLRERRRQIAGDERAR